MRRTRTVLDVSMLPDHVYGPRDVMWWGTLGFMVIEGFTLVLCAVVYVYIGQNFRDWPPQGTPLPALGVPTVQVALMLVSVPALVWTSRAAHAEDAGRVRIGLTLATLFGAVFVALRAVELLVSLGVTWHRNAYGSVQWLVIGAHATLLLIEFVEVAGMAAIFWLGRAERKHFSDAADLAFYWYFMVGAWIPLYALCFLGPRWL
ncbi:MAG TPA: cytochrome c oxidase subunit 3 [Gemmatimonadaceae bacterium]|nr:cytochrome c oxidase subunit 3 [Gemmatimonadaceae bacterium]